MASTVKKAAKKAAEDKAKAEAAAAKGEQLPDPPKPEAVDVSRPNVTDNLIVEAVHAYAKLRAEEASDKEQYDKSKNASRACLKKYKKLGVDPDMITWYDQNKDIEIDELNRRHANINRVAKLMELPIGTQLGFDHIAGETIAAKVDKKKLAKADAEKGAGGVGVSLDTIYKMGKATALDNKPIDISRWPVGSPEEEAYRRGWNEVMEKRAKEMGEPAGAAH